MRSTILFVLLIFDVCLVLFVCGVKGKICNGNEFTITYPNSTFRRCLRCATCHPGFGLEPRCGEVLQHPPNVRCPPCKAGTFSSQYDSSSCKACHQCAKHQPIKEFCSNKSDTICSGKCEKGFYLQKKAPHNCQECSSCCLDGKDEKIQECIDKGLNEQCSPRPDKSCSPYSGATDATKSDGLSITSISIIAVIGAVVLIAAMIATVYTCHRGRKKRHRQETETSNETSYANQDPSTLPSDNRVNFTLPASDIHNPGYQGTPCGSRVDFSTRNNSGPHAMQILDTKQPKSDLSQQSSLATANSSKLPEEKKSRPPLQREGSQDSQTSVFSGDGEAGFRKRSGSAISFDTLKRTFSDRDEPLIEEEQDETHEPIKIDKHPKSQTAKEGSKVEFRCKVQGKSTKLLYEWFKDGEAMRNQNQPSLVLDPVELRDFGHYMCRVRYEDSYGEGVKSSPAKLDVTPQCRNGKIPKLVADVDISTRDKIAVLLENKRYGLGGCREVAAEYGMEDHQIGALSNSKEPGKDVMEFLMGSKPNLTVYDFCKFLKENKIKRFDVVKILEDHFLVRKGSEYV